jgi:hypothetical protein
MKLDDALGEVFRRDVLAVPERQPGVVEISRACSGNTAGCRRVSGFKWTDFIPVLAFTAAAFLALRLNPSTILRFRPLANGLVVSVPDDAGSRLVDFLLEVGESYRSFK